MSHANQLRGLAIVAVMATVAPIAAAQQYKGEILHPMMVTRTGPFATASTGVIAGQQDYITLVNMKGGVEGYKITWDECEFEYKVPDGSDRMAEMAKCVEYCKQALLSKT